MAGKKYIFGH